MELKFESDSNAKTKRRKDLERNEPHNSNKYNKKAGLQTTEITEAAKSKYHLNLLRDIDVAFERKSSSRLVSLYCKLYKPEQNCNSGWYLQAGFNLSSGQIWSSGRSRVIWTVIFFMFK